MKKTLKYLLSIAILFLVFLNLSCKKKKPEYATSTPIAGFLYTDNLGNLITNYGDVSDDWKFTTNLNAAELGLFDFSDTINMANTVVLANPKILPAFPNPAKNYIAFSGQFGSISEYTKLKIVVTDPYLNVGFRYSLLVNGSGYYFFNLIGNFAFQKNGIYRIYYSFSAKDKPNYKMGYGDFQICPGYIATSNCP
ncbi:MAG: hypothetical protein HYX40_07380 [Sphingobacteriales bacterium]|nr:hypothetical protein [Sphingobacteriales bacterium]